MVGATVEPRDELEIFKRTVKRLLAWFFVCLYPSEPEDQFVERMHDDINGAVDLLQVEALESYISLLGERLQPVPEKAIALRHLYEDLSQLLEDGQVARPNLCYWVENGRYMWRQSALRRRLPGIPFVGARRVREVSQYGEARSMQDARLGANRAAESRAGGTPDGSGRPRSPRRFLDVLERRDRRSRSRSN